MTAAVVAIAALDGATLRLLCVAVAVAALLGYVTGVLGRVLGLVGALAGAGLATLLVEGALQDAPGLGRTVPLPAAFGVLVVLALLCAVLARTVLRARTVIAVIALASVAALVSIAGLAVSG